MFQALQKERVSQKMKRNKEEQAVPAFAAFAATRVAGPGRNDSKSVTWPRVAKSVKRLSSVEINWPLKVQENDRPGEDCTLRSV